MSICTYEYLSLPITFSSSAHPSIPGSLADSSSWRLWKSLQWTLWYSPLWDANFLFSGLILRNRILTYMIELSKLLRSPSVILHSQIYAPSRGEQWFVHNLTNISCCLFFFWVTHFNRYAEDTLGWCVIGISFSNFDQSSHPDILGRMASEVCRGSCLFPVCAEMGTNPRFTGADLLLGF